MQTNTAILESFVEGSSDSPFPIYNLPYGVFCREQHQFPRIGTAIGSYVLDLTLLEDEGLLTKEPHKSYFNQDSLNNFASLGPEVWSAMRRRIQSLLSKDNDELQRNLLLLKMALIPQSKVKMLSPFKIGGFSDFYAAENHATNVGRLFRPNDNPLLPNWKYLPVGYNGRPSTVFPSGTKIRRPCGLIKLPNQEAPIFSPTKKLDFELEMGVFVGVGNPEGDRISVENAHSHIFGMVLLNDWSARDIQAFEYQPLGPFLSKSFATSISPWVVTMEALQPFFVPVAEQIPEPVGYLQQKHPKQLDIQLTVELQTKGSNERKTICKTNCKELYWSMEQMLAHHTVNNCIMRPGDLLGTGTISGSEKESWGSLLELSFNGTKPLKLADGSERTFIEDGDSIIFTGFCQAAGYKIGFGTVEGTITPANDV